MTLFQRYKRLTLWNKLGVIASIVGILAFILTVITLPIPERSKPMIVQWDTNALNEEIKTVVAQSIANLKGQENPTNYLTSRWPGFAFNNLLCLGQPIAGRDNYIFDLGQDLARNRMSLFIDTNQNLCFRVIDQDSQAISVRVKLDSGMFNFSQTFYSLCEFGTSNNFSFIRIVINGNEMVEKHQAWPIVISVPYHDMVQRLALDIAGGNGGVFRTRDFAVYTNTLIKEDELELLEYMSEQSTHPRNYMLFNGSNGIVWGHLNDKRIQWQTTVLRSVNFGG
jgi:hypothetical protein